MLYCLVVAGAVRAVIQNDVCMRYCWRKGAPKDGANKDSLDTHKMPPVDCGVLLRGDDR